MIIYGIDINDEDTQPTLGVYLHGELEKKNGYDLCKVDECESGFYRDKPDGIYPCTVVINGKQYESTMYLWQIPFDCGNRIVNQTKGLVVRNDDTKHMDDAKDKYERKTEYI